jgi:RHS repeat-associated protein
MLQRGQFTLQYSNSNHVHAVTKVSSLQTGDTNYTYDTTGNLIERNGDVYRYNAMGKLAEITTAGGDVFQYSYDASGNRIKKQLKNANTTTYNFNNLYEIHRSPGEPEKHTLYIPGIEGDKVAQYTRSDALLVQANVNENKYASIFTDNPDQNSIFDQRRKYLEAKNTLISLFQEIESDIALVLFNIPKPKLYTDNYNMLPSMRVMIWLLAFGILIYYALTLNSQEAYVTRRLRLATSFALFPFFFATSAGCSPLFFGGAQGEEGIPPWFLLAAVPGDTPSVSDEPNFFGGGAGSGASTTNSARITGMYFYHPDHLGSITMITDGRGNVLAGGERGGKSHITYKPYGEILRTDSYGPDISKFKYTGQEEDRESGLMYYKARYYDAKIGRFLQQDSMAFPNQVNGMNRMMYVDGNPVGYRDPSGNSPDLSLITSIAAQLTQPMSTELVVMAMFTKGKGARAIQDIALAQMAYQFLSGQDDFGLSSLDRLQQWNLLMVVQARGNIGKRISEAFRRIGRSMDHSVKGSLRGISGTLKAMNKGTSDGARRIGRAIDGGARWLASGGKFSRNKGNDLDYFYGEFGVDTNGLFDSIQNSDLGRAVTDINQDPCLQIVASILTAPITNGISAGVGFKYPIGQTILKAIGLASSGNNVKGCLSGSDVQAFGN